MTDQSLPKSIVLGLLSLITNREGEGGLQINWLIFVVEKSPRII